MQASGDADGADEETHPLVPDGEDVLEGRAYTEFQGIVLPQGTRLGLALRFAEMNLRYQRFVPSRRIYLTT